MIADDFGVAEWRVFWCDPQRMPSWYAADPVLAGLPSLAEWARVHGTRPGQPVLLRSDGRVAAEVNAFFASPRMRGCSAVTARKYAYALGTWLGFLDAAGRAWHEVGVAADGPLPPPASDLGLGP